MNGYDGGIQAVSEPPIPSKAYYKYSIYCVSSEVSATHSLAVSISHLEVPSDLPSVYSRTSISSFIV